MGVVGGVEQVVVVLARESVGVGRGDEAPDEVAAADGGVHNSAHDAFAHGDFGGVAKRGIAEGELDGTLVKQLALDQRHRNGSSARKHEGHAIAHRQLRRLQHGERPAPISAREQIGVVEVDPVLDAEFGELSVELVGGAAVQSVAKTAFETELRRHRKKKRYGGEAEDDRCAGGGLHLEVVALVRRPCLLSVLAVHACRPYLPSTRGQTTASRLSGVATTVMLVWSSRP